MHRSIRGRRVAPRAPLLLSGLLLTAAACGAPTAPSSPATPSPLASPASSQRLPTPVPTPAGPSIAPSPAVSVPPPAGKLLLRLTTCSHTCDAVPGTTFLDDGRLLWEAPDGSGQVLEARLTEDGVASVRAAIEAAPALSKDGDYKAKLKPGAEPIPHGVGSFRFDVQWAAGPVVVTSWDPMSLADQLDAWTIPAEMSQLADLAARLADPVAWLGVGAFAAQPMPYVPTRVLVRVDLFPDLGDVDGVADVDDVEWPFGGPIEQAGEPIEGEDAPKPRCITLDAADATALLAAEKEAGASRDARLWESIVDYGWDRADGFIQVTVRQLLPYQTGTCAELLTDAP